MKSLMYASTSLLTVVAHWFCCLLPIAAAVLGLGGFSSAMSWVVNYRAYLIAAQVVLMGWSFYHLYFQHAGESRRARWERAMLWVLVGFSIVAWAMPHQWLMSNDQKLATAQVQRVFNARKVTLSLQDRTTPREVEQSLAHLSGVLQLKPEEAGTVSVRYDFRRISKDQLLDVLRKHGVAVEEVEL
ncbi:MAG: hypothetical protein J7576_11005 [Siphonobacter aquaeclarae]|nr:hypothetical protein [Siphonobacter aquaeclarae]